MRASTTALLAVAIAAVAVLPARALGQLEEQSPTICDENVKQYSGMFNLGTQNKKYFYWFFESRNAPATDPTVMWLSGGPGCSSEVALFGENGPCKVTKDASGNTNTTNNPFSWNTRSNLLFVDQPAGTGFSTGTHDSNEQQVGEDMYEFLTAFFNAHPDYIGKDVSGKDKEFFVFGESYAGHYVPAVTHRIFTGNQAVAAAGASATAPHIPLAGLAIGNGLTDPEIQYAYYPQMAYNSTTAPAVKGYTAAKYASAEKAVPGCVKGIANCNANKTFACMAAYEACNLALVEPIALTGINMYNLGEKCAVPPLCYDFSAVTAYLARKDVQAALGVTGGSWSDCNRGVTLGFLGDWMKNYQQLLPDMLAAGIKVLIYAGDQDFICNWLGNQAWTLQLPWAGKAAFNAAPEVEWTAAGAKAAGGKARAADGFTFLQVYKAGHMVPRDQPENALGMLDAFIAGESFTGGK